MFKIVFIGDSEVGKTNILTRQVNGNFVERTRSTIGVDFFHYETKIDNQPITLQLWDTAGQERFKAITKGYYRGTHCVCLVFDITNDASFRKIESWLNEVNTHLRTKPHLVLIGNKADLYVSRQVPTSVAAAYAKVHNMCYVETSAKTSSNLDVLFNEIAELVTSVRRDERVTLLPPPSVPVAIGSVPPRRRCC